jgi:nucleoporin SEH1
MDLEAWTLSDKFNVSHEGEEATCLSWNSSRFDSHMMVVGTTAHCKVWAKNQAERRWEVMAEIGSYGVNDVSWAPNLGRSYHLIAAAPSKSNSVAIIKLRCGDTGGYSEVGNEERLSTASEVWRTEWNITGTVLATSSDDGGISMWRRNFQNKWNLIAEESVSSV